MQIQIKTANSSFYHPPGNGLVERMNKTIKQIITMYVDVEHTNWDEVLQPAISAYNSSLHQSIKCSPYEVLFATKPRILADVMLSDHIDLSGKKMCDYVQDLKKMPS